MGGFIYFSYYTIKPNDPFVTKSITKIPKIAAYRHVCRKKMRVIENMGSVTRKIHGRRPMK